MTNESLNNSLSDGKDSSQSAAARGSFTAGEGRMRAGRGLRSHPSHLFRQREAQLDTGTGGAAPVGSRPGKRKAVATVAVVGLIAYMAGPASAAASPLVSVGAGSYTTAKVGPAPEACGDISNNPRQYLTETAPDGPLPTNDWWSSLAFKKFNCQFSEPLHAHPASFLPNAKGLGVSYTTTPSISSAGNGIGEYHYKYSEDFTAGVQGLNADNVKVADWSDWTVSPYWADSDQSLTATIGHGLPFTYFHATGGDALLNLAAPPTVWLDEGAKVGFTVNGHDYVAYGEPGTDWSVSGQTISNPLGAKDYFSVVVLPTTSSTTASERLSAASSYGKYAYSEVTGTAVSYDYNEATADVTVNYAFETENVSGNQAGTVVALYPHQAQQLTGAEPAGGEYVSPRGPMPVLQGVTNFTTVTKYTGVLPELPAVATGSGAGLDRLNSYLDEVEANPVQIINNDTYWTGKALGRAARIAEMADLVGRTELRDKTLAEMRTVLNDWLTAEDGEAEQLFAYNEEWGTLVGFPGSYGSDKELNDHHFHYGYFVAAAATLAKHDPQWASDAQYGGMVDLLIRDANNYDRSDDMFPYLRDFDIYAGHDWAAGHGAFWAGNNQESSSEGQNFAGALIQWGEATGDTAVRDAGVYLWTTQASAIQNYWFNSSGEAFPAEFGFNGQQHTTVGMVWGDGGAYSTWFSGDPEKIQGINMLPITGNHLYLGLRPEYNLENYAEIVRLNGGEPDAWQDVLWSFLALGDGELALEKFNTNPGYVVEEGETRAHTYHWIANLAALGNVDPSITSNHVLSSVFIKDGARTYVASNVTSTAITVTFSDGTTLEVGPGKTATTGAHKWSGGNGSGGVNPTDPPVEPTDPPVDPTDPPVDPTDPPVDPTDPPVDPTDPPVDPTDPPVDPPAVFASTLFLSKDGKLSTKSEGPASVPVAASSGPADNTVRNATLFQASGLNATFNGGATSFDLGVEAGTNIGNGTQVKVSYDLTGDGTWDRTETYAYFATDPVPGLERYTQKQGLISATGTLGDFKNGKVQVEVWNAIGATPSSLSTGNTSTVTLPFSSGEVVPPNPDTFKGTLFPVAGGALAQQAGKEEALIVPKASGAVDGTVRNPLTFKAAGLNAVPSGGATSFDLGIDAATAVGNGTQVKVSYDFTGDGTWDRTETYAYFATDPVPGLERYTQKQGLISSSGTLGPVVNGVVQVEVWNAIGNAASTLATGAGSSITLPLK